MRVYKYYRKKVSISNREADIIIKSIKFFINLRQNNLSESHKARHYELIRKLDQIFKVP